MIAAAIISPGEGALVNLAAWGRLSKATAFFGRSTSTARARNQGLANMIDGIEAIYQRIADGVVEQLPEDWKSARVDAVFYPESSEYVGEYETPSGKCLDFGVTREVGRAFRELRRKFQESGKSLWGQAAFELHSDGKFAMKWGYDNCDENGNTIWDEQAWHRRQEERRLRLT
ncbi:immunity protein YezG family protein [Blastopirellula marina]|nr:immunity protein YezG family protein [Blastopirellula marina]